MVSLLHSTQGHARVDDGHVPYIPLLVPCDECGAFHSSDDIVDGIPLCMKTDGLSWTSVWKRMPNTAFGICLGLAGQAIMWSNAGSIYSSKEDIGIVFWFASILALLVISSAYVYKMATRFDLVKDEWRNPGRIHFTNAPHLTLIMLCISVPTEYLEDFDDSKFVRRIIWTVAFLSQFVITQFVYERWLFSQTANIFSAAQPQFLLSTVGWFLLAVLGQQVDMDISGLNLPLYCLGAGVILYLLAVISIINRLHLAPGTKGSPVMTLLIAPPSVGVTAMFSINETLASAALGWCLIIFSLLIKLGPKIAGRPPSLGAYWAYVFPLSALATATLRNHALLSGRGAKVMAWVFVGVASLALAVVVVRMSIHIYATTIGDAVWGDPLIAMKERGGSSAGKGLIADKERQEAKLDDEASTSDTPKTITTGQIIDQV